MYCARANEIRTCRCVQEAMAKEDETTAPGQGLARVRYPVHQMIDCSGASSNKVLSGRWSHSNVQTAGCRAAAQPCVCDCNGHQWRQCWPLAKPLAENLSEILKERLDALSCRKYCSRTRLHACNRCLSNLVQARSSGSQIAGTACSCAGPLPTSSAAHDRHLSLPSLPEIISDHTLHASMFMSVLPIRKKQSNRSRLVGDTERHCHTLPHEQAAPVLQQMACCRHGAGIGVECTTYAG